MTPSYDKVLGEHGARLDGQDGRMKAIEIALQDRITTREWNEHRKIMQDMAEDVKTLTAAVTGIVAKNSMAPPCPKPGLCVELETKYDILDKRMDEHDTWRKTMVVGAGVVWFVVMVCGYILYDWVQKHLSTKISMASIYIAEYWHRLMS